MLSRAPHKAHHASMCLRCDTGQPVRGPSGQSQELAAHLPGCYMLHAPQAVPSKEGISGPVFVKALQWSLARGSLRRDRAVFLYLLLAVYSRGHARVSEQIVGAPGNGPRTSPQQLQQQPSPGTDNFHDHPALVCETFLPSPSAAPRAGRCLWAVYAFGALGFGFQASRSQVRPLVGT